MGEVRLGCSWDYDGRAVPIRVEHGNGRYSTIDISLGYIFVNGIVGMIADYKRKEPKKKSKPM